MQFPTLFLLFPQIVWRSLSLFTVVSRQVFSVHYLGQFVDSLDFHRFFYSELLFQLFRSTINFFADVLGFLEIYEEKRKKT